MIDILLPIAAFAAAFFGLDALDFAYSGPAAVIAAVVVILWRMGPSAQTAQQLGLGAPPRWWIIPVGAIGSMVAVILAVTFVARPIATAMNWASADFSGYGDLKGNAAQLAVMLTIAWTTAALGEELIFRGYLIPRLEKAFGGGKLALALAVIAQAGLFGAAHYAQGPAGALQTGIVALTFGIAYVAFGRSLWPLILAHGLINTLSLVALYAGAQAG